VRRAGRLEGAAPAALLLGVCVTWGKAPVSPCGAHRATCESPGRVEGASQKNLPDHDPQARAFSYDKLQAALSSPRPLEKGVSVMRNTVESIFGATDDSSAIGFAVFGNSTVLNQSELSGQDEGFAADAIEVALAAAGAPPQLATTTKPLRLTPPPNPGRSRSCWKICWRSTPIRSRAGR
jgi:hypothetical protein